MVVACWQYCLMTVLSTLVRWYRDCLMATIHNGSCVITVLLDDCLSYMVRWYRDCLMATIHNGSSVMTVLLDDFCLLWSDDTGIVWWLLFTTVVAWWQCCLMTALSVTVRWYRDCLMATIHNGSCVMTVLLDDFCLLWSDDTGIVWWLLFTTVVAWWQYCLMTSLSVTVRWYRDCLMATIHCGSCVMTVLFDDSFVYSGQMIPGLFDGYYSQW